MCQMLFILFSMSFLINPNTLKTNTVNIPAARNGSGNGKQENANKKVLNLKHNNSYSNNSLFLFLNVTRNVSFNLAGGTASVSGSPSDNNLFRLLEDSLGVD